MISPLERERKGQRYVNPGPYLKYKIKLFYTLVTIIGMLITESAEHYTVWVVNDLKNIDVTTSQVASKLQRTNIKKDDLTFKSHYFELK